MKAQSIFPCAIALSLLAGAAAMAQSAPASDATQPPPTPPSAPTAMTPPPTAPTAQSAPAAGAVPPDQVSAPAGTSGGSTNAAVNTSSNNAPGAPHPGANSFTEGEAKSRIEGRGFSDVGDLRLDGQGIWRGKATKDGKSVAVALDYQGNVVAE